MSLDAIFGLINIVALTGWIALLAGPWVPRLSQRAAAFACPAILAAVYVSMIALSLIGGDATSAPDAPQPGFTTLDGVAAIFATREAVLIGWTHYLAFDLLVGAWEGRESKRLGMPHGLLVPCLLLTFLAGPAGFLLFCLLRLPFRSAERGDLRPA